MDRLHNPYAPGAGSPPPELAGREPVRERVILSLNRIQAGRAAKSAILVGLRGVGKTVLLESLRSAAEQAGMHALRLEVPEGRSLPAVLAPQLRLALLKLSRVEQAKDIAQRGLRALAGFAKLKVKYADIEVGMDFAPEPGLADNGDLEQDLTQLLAEVGSAAKAARTAVVLFIDELQNIERSQFAVLIAALHRCAQDRLPLTLVGAGLPQLRMLAGNAKSYAERLFDFIEIGALNEDEAKLAILKPARDEHADFTTDAVDLIVTETRGYPYFLQEWGKHAWDVADGSPIRLADVQAASIEATAALDESFFRVRFDRLRPAEKKYLRAMAELGDGPHRRDRLCVGQESASIRQHSRQLDRERHGLEPQPRRHGFHRPAVRGLYAAHHARRALAHRVALLLRRELLEHCF